MGNTKMGRAKVVELKMHASIEEIFGFIIWAKRKLNQKVKNHHASTIEHDIVYFSLE